MKRIYTLLAALFLISGIATAQCMLYPVPLQERVTKSELIIEGQVISKTSFWNEAHNYVYTSNLVQIKQVLKGATSEQFIEVITEGGIVENFKQEVTPSLQLNENQEGVFFVNKLVNQSRYGYPVYQTYSDEQGYIKFNVLENTASEPFKIYEDINLELYPLLGDLIGRNLQPFYSNSNQQKIISNATIYQTISGFSPASISAGTASVLTINGSGFGTTQNSTNYVEFKNADDGGSTYIQPHSSQYISWTNTQIQVQVPTKTGGSGTAGTGAFRVVVNSSPVAASSALTVTYGHLNVMASNNLIYNTRHVTLNGNGGITWQMYTGFDANTAAKNSFIRAFNTWRCTTYINWQLGSTTSVNTAAADGTDVIRFDVGSELPAGVLGRCTSYWSGCGSSPNLNWYVSELDIVFDDATNWQFGPTNASGSQYDFESVALHELGHGHQLSHVINTSMVMHYSIANAQNKRTLAANEITGATAVMTRNLSGGVCSKPVMVAIAPSSCSLTVPTASFAVNSPACTGQVITLTNQSNGATNYTWTMTGGSPASSNATNPTTSYSSAGIKTISLVASNGLGNSTPYTTTISVLTAPNIAVTSGTICSGNTVSLTASGSSTSYTWQPGNLVGQTQNLSPGITTVYSVTGSNGTCNGTGTGTITVNLTPVISANNGSICAGTATLMVASGATSYTWNPGNLNGNSQTLNPNSTTVYTISGASGNCVGTKTITLNVTTCTGLSYAELENGTRIYPNPTKGTVNLTFSSSNSGDISVTNELGQVIITKVFDNETEIKVNLEDYPKGIYILNVKSKEGKENNFKLIKD